MRVSFQYSILTLTIILIVLNIVVLYNSFSSPKNLSKNCIEYQGEVFCTNKGFDICKISHTSCIITFIIIIFSNLFKLSFCFAFVYTVFRFSINLRNEYDYSIVNNGRVSNV